MKYNIIDVDVYQNLSNLERTVSAVSTSEDKDKVTISITLNDNSVVSYDIAKVLGASLSYGRQAVDGLWILTGMHGLLKVAMAKHFCPKNAQSEQTALNNALQKFVGVELGVLLLPTDYLYTKDEGISSSILSSLKPIYDVGSYTTIDLSAATIVWPNITISSYDDIKNSFKNLLSTICVVTKDTTITTSDVPVKNFCSNAVFFYKPLSKLLSYSALPHELSSTVVADSLYALMRPDLMAPRLMKSLGVSNSDVTIDVAAPDTIGEMIRTLLGKNMSDKLGWVLDTDVEYKKVAGSEREVISLFTEMMAGETKITSGRLLINGVEMVTDEFQSVADVVICSSSDAIDLLKTITMLLSLGRECTHNVEGSTIINKFENPRLTRLLDKRAEL